MRAGHVAVTAALVIAVSSAGGVLAASADKVAARPQLFKKLIDCRSITDNVQRLACYDAQVAAIDRAEQSRDIAVVDREQVRETRRTLFGLSLPNLKLFGGDDREEDEIKEITGVVASATQDRDGQWLVRLQDGAKWRQIDGNVIARDPRSGSKVLIKRASFGSFVMKIDNQPGFKARREN